MSGESWLVHGGGFYHAQKYMVAPDSLPEELHWFKYEAYFTWVTGFLLLALIYYWGAESFLIDRFQEHLEGRFFLEIVREVVREVVRARATCNNAAGVELGPPVCAITV